MCVGRGRDLRGSTGLEEERRSLGTGVYDEGGFEVEILAVMDDSADL